MKNIVKSAVALFALVAGCAVHATPLYNYSYTFGDGHVLSGSFRGTANGDLVTGLTDMTAAIDGKAFPASVGEHWDQGYALVGGAQASFSGNSNNFMFVDQEYADTHTYLAYFRYLSGSLVDMYDTRTYEWHVDWFPSGAAWSLTAANETPAADVPEPNSGAVMLAGACLMGLVLYRRKAG
jgi:hypothetical protein